MSLNNLRKLTATQLTKKFKSMGCEIPPENKTYYCDKESPIRPIAEYEDMGGVLLAYVGTEAPDSEHKQLPPSGKRTFGVPNELIVRMQQLDSAKDEPDKKPVHIFILCDDENEKKNIIESLQKTADKEKVIFDPELVHLIPWDADTYWTRDYCPWWVKYKDKDIYAVSKHIYTSLGGGSVGMIEGAENVNPREGSGIFRCNDDYGAVKISDYFNAPIRKRNKAVWADGQKLPHIEPHRWFFSGLLNVGGNYMATSNGVIASSYLVATQNELPEDNDPENPNNKNIEERMKYIMEQTNRFLGANTYHVLTDPTGTYIGHIDCWGKFLSDDKIMIAQSNNAEINKGLDAIADFFSNQLVGKGEKKFEVYRVTCPNIYVANESEESVTTAPYTNSLILNNHVYVPLCGNKDFDKAAIEAYKMALPDYKIVGIIGKPKTPWLGTDALHCRTNAIPRTIVERWLESQKSSCVDKYKEIKKPE